MQPDSIPMGSTHPWGPSMSQIYCQSNMKIQFNNNQGVSSPVFWNDRYLDGNTKWDIGGATPIITDYLGNKQNSIGKVCILGCGNGHDAMEFSRYDNDVYAVDFSDEAIKNLKNLSIKNNLTINLIKDDIFHLVRKYSDYFDMVFEYTCFCAIDPSRRIEYFNLVYSILNDNGLLFGIFIPLDKSTDDGPQFRVSIDEIKDLVEGKFIILENFFSALSIDKRKNREKVLILKKIVK